MNNLNDLKYINPLDNIKIIDYILNNYNYKIKINDKNINFSEYFKTSNIMYKLYSYNLQYDNDIIDCCINDNIINKDNKYFNKHSIYELQVFLTNYKSILKKHNLQECTSEIKYLLNNNNFCNHYINIDMYNNFTKESINSFIRLSKFYQDKLFIYMFTNINNKPLIYYYNINNDLIKTNIQKIIIKLNYNIFIPIIENNYVINIIDLVYLKYICKQHNFIQINKLLLNCFNTNNYPNKIEIINNTNYIKINKINNLLTISELSFNNNILKFPLILQIKSGFYYFPNKKDYYNYYIKDNNIDYNFLEKLQNKEYYINCLKYKIKHKQLINLNILTKLGDCFYKNYINNLEFNKFCNM